LEVYVGLDYVFSERRFYNRGGSTSREGTSFGPFGGILYFINPNVALDIGVLYPVVRRYKQTNFTSYQNGEMELQLGINFYFDSKLKKDTVSKLGTLRKGLWITGGGVSIGRANDVQTRSRQDLRNRLSPYVGVMLHKRWMVGGRLSYENSNSFREFFFGFQPFGRYYFRQRQKRMFYAEANMDFQFRYYKDETIEKGFSSTERVGGIGLGVNRWIIPGSIALDYFLGWETGEVKPPTFASFTLQQRLIFRLGLEGYF